MSDFAIFSSGAPDFSLSHQSVHQKSVLVEEIVEKEMKIANQSSSNRTNPNSFDDMDESNPVVARSSTEEGNETILSRKEKKKLAKKKKRKEKRKEMAERKREEEEARANDAEEQRKLEMMMKEEEEKRERALKEFEERERIWIQEMELKKKEEEEERRKVLEEIEKEEEDQQKFQVENENEYECAEDDDWEYVEDGPAEIIWQGNEIIISKKKVRVLKKDANQLSEKEDVDRPTSNPLPPQSKSFADFQNAQQALENVARQVPNFGTEQDKAHCPFHLKTGACRFGQRCSRVHFYPDKSCTLLMKNMYNGPGLAWEQDEGLEYTDEEVERSYVEFYEDVHTEFLKFGEIVNFKVCRNGSSHLRGNVYVHFKSLESAILAYRSVNGRYFASKQVTCEFVNVTRWKVAICGEYMKSRLKMCSRGMACNFIHCFRNPGGDYEWADWDKPPPRYWMKKMAALFSYSEESECRKWNEDHLGHTRSTNKIDTLNGHRHRSGRSRSRSHDSEHIVGESSHSRRHTSDNRKRVKLIDEKLCEEGTELKENHHIESRSDETNSDVSWSDRDRGKDRDKCHGHTRKHIKHRSNVSEKSTDYYRDTKDRTYEADSDGNWLDEDGDAETHHIHTKQSSRYRSRREVPDDGGSEDRTFVADRDWKDMNRDGKRCDSRRLGKRSSSVSKERDDTGSFGDWWDGDKSKDGYQSCKKRSLDHPSNISKSVEEDGIGKSKAYYTNSCYDSSDRDDGHRSCRRKRPRHRTEESESSDDLGEPTNKLKQNLCNRKSASEKSDHPKRDKTNKDSSRRSHSRKDKNRTDYGPSKSKRDHKSSHSDHLDERCNKSIDEHDRWKLINTEEDQKSNPRETDSIYEPGSPRRYNGRCK